jgi:hypothetical protein
LSKLFHYLFLVFSGEIGIRLSGGLADGFQKPGELESAYCLEAALATYTKNGSRWLVGAGYFNKEYGYKNVTIPVSQFIGEGGYHIKLLSTVEKRFSVLLCVGTR